MSAEPSTIGCLQAIAAKLQPDYMVNPNVSAEVITRRPFYVIGEVQKPGNYPYVTDIERGRTTSTSGASTRTARWFASRQTPEPYFRQATPLKSANGFSDGLCVGPAIGWRAQFHKSQPNRRYGRFSARGIDLALG